MLQSIERVQIPMVELLEATSKITPFQRRKAWKKRGGLQKTLINDFLAGRYIPAIVLSRRGKFFYVLDGLQRIQTFRAGVEGKLHKEIPDDSIVEKLKLANVSVEIISGLSEKDELELFLKLNKNKVQLNAPELRRAQFYDHAILQVFNDDLKGSHSDMDWAESFYSCVSKDKKQTEELHSRCLDEDIALQLLAFSNYNGLDDIKVSKNNYLDVKSLSKTEVRRKLDELIIKLNPLVDVIRDNSINHELRIRGSAIAVGMFDHKQLSNLKLKITEVLKSVDDADIANTDNRSMQFWNAALKLCYKRLMELKENHSRVFSKQMIEKK
jgi:hypothetical protein